MKEAYSCYRSIGITRSTSQGNLESVRIPDSVSSIGNFAFQACSTLKPDQHSQVALNWSPKVCKVMEKKMETTVLFRV